MNKNIGYNFEKQENIRKMLGLRNFKYVKQACLAYLEKYPDDFYVKNYLGMAYLVESNFDTADAIFTSTLGTKDEEFSKYFLIKIAIAKGKYELAHKYCNEMLDKMYIRSLTNSLTKEDEQRRNEVKIAKNYIETILEINENKDSYMYEQLRNYGLDKTLEHIKKHQAVEKDTASFCENIDLTQLLIETSEKIKNMQPEHYPIRLTTDFYYFYYPNIGQINNEKVNYFRVVTFQGSKDILTMYPVIPEKLHTSKNIANFQETQSEKLIDINQENVRVRTGLERFNARYKRK